MERIDTVERRAVRAFLTYRITSRLYFHLPILILFFLHSGQNHLQAGVLLAAYSLVVTCLGIPAGKLADRYGYRKFIFSGELLKVAGLLGLLYFTDFTGLLLSQLISGIGYVLASGADSAALRQSVGDQERYQRHERNAHVFVFLAIFIATLCGGILATFDMRYPLMATLPFALLAALLATAFPAPPVRHHTCSDNHPPTTRIGPEARLNSWLLILNYGFVRALVITIFVAAMPLVFFLEMRVPLYVFGALLASYTLSSILFGHRSKWIAERLGFQVSFSVGYLTLLLCLLALALTTINPYFGYVAPILMGYAAGVTRPLTLMLLIDSVPVSSKAEALSHAESANGILSVLMVAAFCSTTHFLDLSHALWSALAFSTLFLLLMYVSTARRRPVTATE